MSTQRKRDPGSILSDEGVAEYLRQHPEFFEQHAELLARIHVPHRSGEATSLVERQVKILREQNQQLERRLVDLVEVARANDLLVGRMHELSLAMIDAPDTSSALAGLTELFKTVFEADEASLVLFEGSGIDGPDSAIHLSRDDDQLKAFSGFLSAAKPQCGQLRDEQLQLLFGDKAKRVRSSAIIPLGDRVQHGLLAIGSKKADRFTANMATEYLSRMGEIVSARLG